MQPERSMYGDAPADLIKPRTMDLAVVSPGLDVDHPCVNIT